MRELSLNVMDVVQNSISAQATQIGIHIQQDTSCGKLIIQITDNGRGMTAQQVEQVIDPFYTTRTTRKVGLGVPFFKMASEMTGGSFSIQSQPGQGTTVTAEFLTGHIDMTPLGDMGATVLLLIHCNPHIDFHYTHRQDTRSVSLDTQELRDILEGVPLNNPEVVQWIREHLEQLHQQLQP